MTLMNCKSKLIFEKNYGYVAGSASGESKKAMKRYNRVFWVSLRLILIIRQRGMKRCLKYWLEDENPICIRSG